ncbi:hypothetical protein [Acholeplasma hippikon]|uniref:Uncharacterized protein n=1 Tax=Acholeplasma hippikon TaxID=264636 RepID=A0A449BIX4_9MOLU|nr:hypothetical protein [Acholeplasma hippikon]VEU82409.1 Uncharacterised protein [Acholeplasma hippikon]
MTNRVKLACLMLLPVWGCFINLYQFMVNNQKYTYEYKKKPLVLMTLVILVSYVLLIGLNNYLINSTFNVPDYNFIGLIIVGWLVNIIHYFHYTLVYLKK